MMEKNKPIKTYRVGTLTLTMWENETEDNNKVKSFSFKRSYKNDQDEWNQTQNLRTNDLLKLCMLLQEAYKENMISVEE